MDGRWTIHLNKFGLPSSAPVVGGQSVPVVPCDDAAIERVAVRLADEYMGGWAALDENTRAEIREAASDLLRTAGETP